MIDCDSESPDQDAPLTVRVLVVDDHEPFRALLAELVSATPGFCLVGEASCGEDALAISREVAPDFVVMDMRMPGMGGIEAARELLSGHPARVVLLISAQRQPTEVIGPLGGSVSFARKEDLRSALLREAWERRALRI